MGMLKTYGRKKCSIAIANFKKGTGVIKINNIPINLIEPKIIKAKILEPIYIIGFQKIRNINIKVFVKGGGSISRIYAIRQVLARSILSYYTYYKNNIQSDRIKYLFLKYDRKLLVIDARKVESKKFSKSGARSRYQSSYR